MPGDASPLEAAIVAGDPKAVARAIIADPSSAVTTTTAGVSPLLLACYHHRPDLVAAICPHTGDLDVFEAAATGDCERLRMLLDGDPGAGDAMAPDGFFPLALAAFFGHVDAVTLLLEHGVAVHRRAANPTQVQAIHSAAAAGRSDIVAALLDHGADANARQQGGATPLLAAAMRGAGEMTSLLLEAGADPSLAADDGRTPAMLAAESGHHDLAALLRSLD